jgi:hypothetical protein
MMVAAALPGRSMRTTRVMGLPSAAVVLVAAAAVSAAVAGHAAAAAVVVGAIRIISLLRKWTH